MMNHQPGSQLKSQLSTLTIKISTQICAGGANHRRAFRAGGTQGYGMAGGQFHNPPSEAAIRAGTRETSEASIRLPEA
ncbi:hypothetical protein PV415_29660, partial [Streptomyces sp. ME03-5684b]|uniref:hypothetical protein n=1 Tax=Streptomyces sp. ME03-5684b TaxID=3028681 RepID=UPI0029AD2374